MKKEVNFYLKLGDVFLEQAQRGKAVTCYKHALEEDPGNHDVVGRIKQVYLQPVWDDTKQIYNENCVGMSEFAYEDCVIDFISTGNGTYELFDKEENQFVGSLDVNIFHISKNPEKKFSSILIADYWDLRELLPLIKGKRWARIYIVLNNMMRRFMSFFKLAEIHNLLPNEIQLFTSTEEMYHYFEQNPDIYLPKKVFAPEGSNYAALLSELHSLRIRSRVASNNVFLSICIPSYNRGKLALSAVKHALTSEYDAEIEIIVSNNGSLKGKKEYQEIKRLWDSRVRYYEFEENQGYATNVYNCLKSASGNFAILLSDEDILALENADYFENFLDYLNMYPDLGGCITNDVEGIQSNYAGEIFKKGFDASLVALTNTAYISGICYNIDYLKSNNLLKEIDNLRRNLYVEYYLHSACFLLMAGVADLSQTGMPLWHHAHEWISEDVIDGIQEAAQLENRLAEEAGVMQLLEKYISDGDYKKWIKLNSHKYFGALATMYRTLDAKIKTKYSWIDICIIHYKNWLKIVEKSRQSKENMPAIIKVLDEVFLDWLDCRRIRPIYTEEENLKATLRAHIARYLYHKGTPFLEIDFEAIDQQINKII